MTHAPDSVVLLTRVVDGSVVLELPSFRYGVDCPLLQAAITQW